MKKVIFYLFLWLFVILMERCGYIERIETANSVIGTYSLNLSKSNILLTKGDSAYFNNLTFRITEDSFMFSRMIPYEDDSVGTWETEYIPPAVYIKLKFRKRGIWQIGPELGYINMPCRYTFEKYPKKTGNLYFVKINEK